jgi:hypothetical protein
MRAEGCLLILSGLPLILSPQKDRGCGCVLIRSPASTSCTARHDSRRDKRRPTGMTIMPMVDTERRTAPTEGAFYGATNL